MTIYDDSTVRGELQTGEKLLWTGKPSPIRIVLRDSEALVSACLMLVIVFIALIAFSRTPQLFDLRFSGFHITIQGIVLFLMLLVLAFLVRPISEFWLARRTIYALTNQRAMILVRGGRNVESYTHFEKIERRERSDGSGDLIFGREIAGSQRTRYYRSYKIGFFGIPNVRQVEQLLISMAGAKSL